MRFKTVFAASIAILGCSGALAQVPLTPSSFLLRVGAFKPSSSSGSAFGETWFTGGVEMDLFKINLGPAGAKLSFSVDTYSKGGATSVPVLLNYSVRVDKFKYSAGTGVSFVNRTGFTSSVRWAFQISIGYDLSVGLPLTLEARYFGVAGNTSAFDGFAFTVGFRL
jgi:hypothetical protein